MNKTIGWAATFGMLVGIATLFFIRSGQTPQVAIVNTKASGRPTTLGGSEIVGIGGVKKLSSAAEATCMVAIALARNQRIDESCKLIRSVPPNERNEVCEEVFKAFYGDWTVSFDEVEDDAAAHEAFLQRIVESHEIVHTTNNAELRAKLLSHLVRQRGRVPTSTSPTVDELIAECRQELVKIKPNVMGVGVEEAAKTPWYSVVLAGLYAGCTSAVGWKLFESALSEVGKGIGQHFLITVKPNKKSAEDSKAKDQPVSEKHAPEKALT